MKEETDLKCVEKLAFNQTNQTKTSELADSTGIWKVAIFLQNNSQNSV